MVTSAIVSILITFGGDFKAQLQFDGPLKSDIKAEIIQAAEKNCDVSGRFEEINLKEKNQLEKYLKADFQLFCVEDKQTKITKLASEYVRLSDLKPQSNSIYISNKFKKNTIKIENYSVQISKKK
jgi:hypothetical protein